MSGFNCLNCLVSNVFNVFNVASVSLSFWSKFYNCLVFNVYMVLSSMSTWSGLKCLNGLSCLIVSNVFSSMSSMSQMSGLPCLHVSPYVLQCRNCLIADIVKFVSVPTTEQLFAPKWLWSMNTLEHIDATDGV